MDKNQIKKVLYKARPPAELVNVTKERIRYIANFDYGDTHYILSFSIPLGDIEHAKFESIMEAKLLIRWMDQV